MTALQASAERPNATIDTVANCLAAHPLPAFVRYRAQASISTPNTARPIGALLVRIFAFHAAIAPAAAASAATAGPDACRIGWEMRTQTAVQTRGTISRNGYTVNC